MLEDHLLHVSLYLHFSLTLTNAVCSDGHSPVKSWCSGQCQCANPNSLCPENTEVWRSPLPQSMTLYETEPELKQLKPLSLWEPRALPPHCSGEPSSALLGACLPFLHGELVGASELGQFPRLILGTKPWKRHM